MRNFDDYLTPFPLLYTLKERLAFFEKNGVAGVFYNGKAENLKKIKLFYLFRSEVCKGEKKGCKRKRYSE